MNATACYFMSTMADENAEIARGLRRRDSSLLDHLVEKYQHRLLRYLVYLTGQRQIAEDIFQETWIRVLERGRQYDGNHEFSTWLFTIGRNLYFDYLRRHRPANFESLTADDNSIPFDIEASRQPSAFDATVQREQNEQISSAMQHIAAEYRETLVLRFHEGMSLEEISNVTGAPLGTVKSRIYRGLSALEPWVKGARL